MSTTVDIPRTKPIPLDHMVLCGAKTRGGGPCKRPVSKGRGKCDLHGGKTLTGPDHPAFKDGKQSKHFYLPPILKARVENIAYDLIGNIEESVKTQMALESQYLEKLNTGESPAAWKEIFEIATETGEFAPKPEQKLASIIRIADGALEQDSLVSRIQSIHETQRKLSESVSKIRKEMQEVYTKEQWDAMLNVLFNLVVRIFASPNNDPVGTFYRELTALARPEPKQIGG